MAKTVDKVQQIKDRVLELDPPDQIRIAFWFEALKDVRLEDARKEAARKNKPETKKEETTT